MTENKRVRKYRVWNQGLERMEYDYIADKIRFDFHGCIISYWGEAYLPLEFTGLSDKNGKEIYEGDIFRPFLESIGPYWVVFENGSFVCYHRLGRWGLLSRVFDADILRDYSAEVIGNIYENPELISSGI